MKGREFAPLLEKHGWQLKRVSGSHHIYAEAGNPARLSVPIHGNKDLKTGLVKHLVKLAGVDEKEV